MFCEWNVPFQLIVLKEAKDMNRFNFVWCSYFFNRLLIIPSCPWPPRPDSSPADFGGHIYSETSFWHPSRGRPFPNPDQRRALTFRGIIFIILELTLFNLRSYHRPLRFPVWRGHVGRLSLTCFISEDCKFTLQWKLWKLQINNTKQWYKKRKTTFGLGWVR